MPSLPNAFEAGGRKVIPAVLIYLIEGDRVLMIHRNADPTGKVDFHSGKWNGLGGKLEQDESALQAAQRELREESGLHLELEQFRSQGVIHFPNFKPHKNEDWMVFLFTAQCGASEAQQVQSQSAEGSLHWIKREDVAQLNLWPGDRLFIHHILAQKPLAGTIWYRDGQVEQSWIQPLA